MDEDLPRIQAVAAGQEPALAALMERHRDTVFRLAWRLVHDERDAAEITAETFVRVHRHAARFVPRGTVRSWILAIAANLSRDLLRRRRFLPLLLPFLATREDHDAPSVPEPGSGEADLRDQLERREQAEALRAAIDRLPLSLRLPFVLCAVEDHPQDEAAAILGLSRKAVETRVARARARLADDLRSLRT